MRNGAYQYLGFLERIYLRRPDKIVYGTHPLSFNQKEWIKRAPLPPEIDVDVVFGRVIGDPKKYKAAIPANPDLKYAMNFYPPEKSIARIDTCAPVPVDMHFRICAKNNGAETCKLTATFLDSGNAVMAVRNAGEKITIDVPKSLDNQMSVGSAHALTVYAKSASSCPDIKAGHYAYGFDTPSNFRVFGA